MKAIVQKSISKIQKSISKITSRLHSKQDAELIFWQEEIGRYARWYKGDLSPLYRTPSPSADQKVSATNTKDASVLSWHKLHQEVKYLEDLQLAPDAFKGMKLLDVGSGPMPSATCFQDCILYCLEPLLPKYLEAGFPLHYYDNVRFIHARSEEIPVEAGSFDAVISVNAIDHVDDIQKTAVELRRVLKSDGLFRMHVHYHAPEICEPISFNDELFRQLFSWCPNLRKVKVSSENRSHTLPPNQTFVLWSNF